MSDDQTDAKRDSQLEAAFIEEGIELVGQAEEFLLAIEKNHGSANDWDGLFRVFHNIKGSAGLVGFVNLCAFAHQVENLISALKKETLVSTTEVMDCLLSCVDRLKTTLEGLGCGSKEIDHSDITRRVQMILEGKPTGVPSPDLLESVVSRSLEAEGNEDTACRSPTPSGCVADEIIKVSMKKIDELLNNLGEQVILQNALEQAKYDYNHSKDNVLRAISQLGKLNYDIQQLAMGLRTVTLRKLFTRLDRSIRDASNAVQKRIHTVLEGQDQELDKTIVDALSDPLIHMVRNAVDHGIESLETRRQNGKSDIGSILIRAYRKGGFFYFEIEDDGGGIDSQQVLAKAIRQGLVRAEDQLAESEILNLIFRNGFSTRETVTDISGRGVGMDVVYQALIALKGNCKIDTVVGKGTRFMLRLPLTLAVFNGTVVTVRDSQYVIPNSDIEEVISLRGISVRNLNKSETLVEIKQKVMPMVDLEKLLKVKQKRVSSEATSSSRTASEGVLIISKINGVEYAFRADSVVTQQRVVYKPLTNEMKRMEGAAGATILGDGSVALIIEFAKLVSKKTPATARA